ncbi:hypothetical protein LY90DRAFT_261761 [Neocallimastix californiae]|uniref:Uncharacterized protein n=1 Tax=Neocallimastix californiae TaxID=1754190 RepID=A0A1Y2D9Q7_9FUNG|nr:hypothetical protein LY90DRAFT_261761 [Neocallimastix californiae]|eukprot:ORY55990.1 hypothetical protein LY90DRAFT_261761 [Neocallimastix californiae]
MIKDLKKKIYNANMKSFILNKSKFTNEEPTYEQIQMEDKYNYFSKNRKSESYNNLFNRNNSDSNSNKIESNDYSFYHGKMMQLPTEKKPMITSTSQSSLKIPEYIHIHSLDKKSKNKDEAVQHIKNLAHSLNKYKHLYSTANNSSSISNESESMENTNSTSLPTIHVKTSKKKDKISITKEIEKKQSIKNLSMGKNEEVDLNMVSKNPMVNKLPPLNRSASSINEENQSRNNEKEETTEVSMEQKEEIQKLPLKIIRK